MSRLSDVPHEISSENCSPNKKNPCSEEIPTPFHKTTTIPNVCSLTNEAMSRETPAFFDEIAANINLEETAKKKVAESNFSWLQNEIMGGMKDIKMPSAQEPKVQDPFSSVKVLKREFRTSYIRRIFDSLEK